MQISARNQLKGKVTAINEGPGMTAVTLQTAGGEEITAVITRSSADRLQISVGKEVYAVIKATDIMIMTD